MTIFSETWVVDQFGQSLKQVTLPIAELSPDHVRIRVRAVSLNFRDHLVAKGDYDPKIPRPHVLGSDASGEVIEVGSGAPKDLLGKKVVIGFAPTWLDGLPNREMLRATLGGGLPGVFSEWVDAPVAACVEHQRSHEDACTLVCAGTTAYQALFELGQLASKPESTVLVQGSGGVSVFALQLAKSVGARVIALTSRAANQGRLQALGADQVLVVPHGTEYSKVVRTICKEGVDHVVEVTGGSQSMTSAIRSMAPGGNLYVIGVLQGAVAELNMLPVMMNSLSLRGVMVGPLSALRKLVQHVETHQVKPVIDSFFSWDQMNDAMDRLRSGQHIGKIVVTTPP